MSMIRLFRAAFFLQLSLCSAARAASPVIQSVVNGASFQNGLASGTWITLQGSGLSATSRQWQSSDFVGNNLPTSLDNVQVKINGLAAYVYYISPTQLNVLAPEDPTAGPVSVQVFNAVGSSNIVTVTKQAVAPALFVYSQQSGRYAIGEDGGTYGFIGPAGLLGGGAVTTPATPGETVVLYATGLGATNPAYSAGQIIQSAIPLGGSVQVLIGSLPASVQFAGIIGPGLYQLNVVVPALPTGDASIVIVVGGTRSPGQVFIPIQGASNTITLSTSYTYDAADRIASITYPSGWKVSYTRDAMGRVTAVSAQAPGGAAPVPVVTNVTYEPFGPVTSVKYGNGVAETRSFDLDYRLTSLIAAGNKPVQNLGYGYDAANNVLSITDGITLANTQRLGYDTLDRLTSATGPYGNLSYTYDPVGNRLTQTIGTAATSYAYAAKSNRLSSTTAGGATQGLGYTATGNINGFSPGAAFAGPDSMTSLAYNQSGRLAGAVAGTKVIEQFGYNAFGQRLVKAEPSIAATTLYQYDQRGRLLEESNNQGNPAATDYIYLDDGRPIATLTPVAGNLYFLHDDRLGTPQTATDTSQAVAWNTTYQPFGQTGNIQDSFVQPQNLRLPGQEFDADSGFYHNGFRDYVPAWGRYIESDPIGLSGGLNTFGYGAENPVRQIDPFGQCPASSGIPPAMPGTTNADDPGWVLSSVVCFPFCEGTSFTGAGDEYINIGIGLPGANASALLTTSMSGFAEGWSLNYSLWVFAGGLNASSAAFGGTLPPTLRPGISLTWGVPVGAVLDNPSVSALFSYFPSTDYTGYSSPRRLESVAPR